MADLATLRRRRDEAKLALLRAELKPKRKGRGKVAEQYLKKGSKVYVEGQLATRKWTDQQGVEKYTTEVVLQKFRGELTLLDKVERDPPSQDDYGSARTRDTSAGYGTAKAGDSFGAQPPSSSHLDDDIPF